MNFHNDDILVGPNRHKYAQPVRRTRGGMSLSVSACLALFVGFEEMLRTSLCIELGNGRA